LVEAIRIRKAVYVPHASLEMFPRHVYGFGLRVRVYASEGRAVLKKAAGPKAGLSTDVLGRVSFLADAGT
jgi:hypothetical protein